MKLLFTLLFFMGALPSCVSEMDMKLASVETQAIDASDYGELYSVYELDFILENVTETGADCKTRLFNHPGDWLSFFATVDLEFEEQIGNKTQILKERAATKARISIKPIHI